MGISVVGVEKRFGHVMAVSSFNLTVNEGELVAIVGPSGCGKTTLLRSIAGLENPDRGRIHIHGRDVTRVAPEKRDVGLVFQQFALFPNMNVTENIAYGLKRKRVARRDRDDRVAEMIEMVGLTGLEKRRPDQLSAGQQQRVALARAVGPRPKTLLLDEPFSALDASIRKRLRADLKTMQRNLNITTIMVTHDQEEALAVADRVAVMNEGRLEQIGTPWELYDAPKTNFVAKFIGRGNYLSAESDEECVSIQGLGTIPINELDDREDAFSRAKRGIIALVRPESVTFGDDIPERSLVFRAIIDDISFGGETSLVQLTLATSPKTRLISAVSGREARSMATRIGDQVRAYIRYDDIGWVSSGLDKSDLSSADESSR